MEKILIIEDDEQVRDSVYLSLESVGYEVMEVATSYIPRRFPWWIFGIGEAVILASIAWYWKRAE